jgi:hypothetical protein
VQEAWAALLARFKDEKLSGFVLVQQEAPRWMSVKAAKEKLLPHLAKIKGTARKSQPVAA